MGSQMKKSLLASEEGETPGHLRSSQPGVAFHTWREKQEQQILWKNSHSGLYLLRVCYGAEQPPVLQSVTAFGDTVF